MSTSTRHKRSVSQYSLCHIMSLEADELSDEELFVKVAELKHQNKIFRLENEVLEKSLARIDPALLTGVQQTIEYIQKIQVQMSSSVSTKSPLSRIGFSDTMPSLAKFSPISKSIASPSKMSFRRGESSARLAASVICGTSKINIIERAELVNKSMEMLISDIERVRKKAERKYAAVKAQLEETSIRVKDIDKTKETFTQNVIEKGYDDIIKKIPAETWIKYMREWIKTADKQMNKLRLRTSTFTMQYAKLKSNIEMKTELARKLTAVDFDKLQIENDVCLKQLDEKTGHLEELKKEVGDTNLRLMNYKKAMWTQQKYLDSVKVCIADKCKKTKHIYKEKAKIESEVENLTTDLDKIKKITQKHLVPDLTDYINVKTEVLDLKKTIKLLENRINLNKVAVLTLHRKLKRLSMI